MSDEFSFGEPAKHPARLGKPLRPPAREPARARAGSSHAARLMWIVAGLVVAGTLAFVFLRGADEAGKQIADSQLSAVSEIDRANDAAAQGTMGRAVVVALTLYAENGSFTTDLATLSAYDPSLRFTSGPSNGPTTISYSADAAGFGAAIRSESSTCWWARIDTAGVATYGSGTPCTGTAAMAASAASW